MKLKLVSISLIFACLLLIVTDSEAWSFSNLLMVGSQTFTHGDTVALGADIGLQECRQRFQWSRWNCPENTFASLLSQDNLPANREIAFVRSIVNAGIVHVVTRSCSTGQIENCSCDIRKRSKSSNSTRGDFRWGGCSDNVEFGIRLSKTFLDEREKGRDSKAFVNLHNNEMGRRAVKSTMSKICKCHGVSGSCALQTCWMRITDFSNVGRFLKKSYHKAIKIDSNTNFDNSGNSVFKTFARDASLPNTLLVYIEDSPDYCYPNSTFASNGTIGRVCSRRKGANVSVEERHSCRKLCKHCGFKVKKLRATVTSSCNCKFKWCCDVQCEQCTRKEVTYVCEQ